MSKRPPKNDPVEIMMDTTMAAFKQAKQAIKEIKQTQIINARATYQGLTVSGKSRYVASLAKETGSQVEVAEMLNLTAGRISQLIKSDKNRKNGK